MLKSYKKVRIPIKKCVLARRKNIRTIIDTGSEKLPEHIKEDTKMALSNLAGWTQDKAASACGTACGASDKPEEKPAACGTACGAGDKPEEKPAACGTACGAGDKN